MYEATERDVQPGAEKPAADAASTATEGGPAGEDKGEAPKKEIGGRDGPDPTRYGDWEKDGRCIDF